MKNTNISNILTVLFAVVLFFGPVGLADPLGTAFTYQGLLIDANQAANGLYDFQFKLFDANTAGNEVASDVNIPNTDVVDGYFTALLDFGNVFDGNALWLEIGVRPGAQNDPNVYTTLSPRQQVTPSPSALSVYGLSVSGDNTFTGNGAGLANTTGTQNTFSGYQAGYSNTDGRFNTFIGYQAGYSNDGYFNTFSGYSAGYSNTSGWFNTFSGDSAGGNNTTGNSNTFSGHGAGLFNTTGSYNTFSGEYAGQKNTTGSYNTFSGVMAGNNNTTGSGNVFIGYQAGYSETTSNKLYIANNHPGALIYGDFSANTLGFGTTSIPAGYAINTATGAYLTTGGTWTNNSSRDVKENITPVDTREVLEKLVSVPVSTWNYKVEDQCNRHVGPMAQDFYAAFGLNDSDTSIATIDADGISLAAIQGLYQVVKEKDNAIESLQKENESMKRENEEIKARLSAMESIVSQLSQQQDGGTK